MRKCNFCDQRGATDDRIRHSIGCPFRKEMRECKECGRVGEHAPRCPYVLAKEKEHGGK